MPSTLGADAIVQIWEQGRRQHPVDRALTILSILSGHSRGPLAELSVETRDRLLLEWHGRLFGSTIHGNTACERCGCGVDVALTAPRLAPVPDEPFEVELDGRRVRVRLPTSVDLAAIAACTDVEVARDMLLRRCVEGPWTELPPAGHLRAVEAELDRRAAASAVAVVVACPDCGHGWSLELDAASFLWRKIEILAGRLLSDVDVLARRYGWSEGEILGLTSTRRRFYLELAS